MKKKVVSVLLCLSMFTAMAAGCGSSSEGTSNATAVVVKLFCNTLT